MIISDWHQAGCIAIFMALGSVLQSAAGFGMGLFCTPLLLGLGLSLPESIAIVRASSFFQTLLGSWHLRANIPWKLVWHATILRWLMMPVGASLLGVM